MFVAIAQQRAFTYFMRPHENLQAENRRTHLLHGGIVHSSAWQVGPFFCVGKATFTLRSGRQRVELLTAAGISLDHVHELLIKEAQYLM